jgi:hypothetical protein
MLLNTTKLLKYDHLMSSLLKLLTLNMMALVLCAINKTNSGLHKMQMFDWLNDKWNCTSNDNACDRLLVTKTKYLTDLFLSMELCTSH